MLLHLFENTVAHRKAALAANIHLDEIGAALVEQVHEPSLVRLVFASRNRELGRLLQSHIRPVIFRRQRLLKPCRLILRHRIGQVQNRLRRIRLITHAPPRMRVDHQTNIRPDRSTHLPHRFQIRIRPAGRPHLVRVETHARNRSSLLRKMPRLHIHSSAAIKLDSISLGTTREFAQRAAFKSSNQVHNSNLNRPISLGQFRVALKIKAWPGTWFAPLQKRRDNLQNLAFSPFVGRPRSKTA